MRNQVFPTVQGNEQCSAKMRRQASSAHFLLDMGKTKIQHGGCVRVCEMHGCRPGATGDEWKNGEKADGWNAAATKSEACVCA